MNLTMIATAAEGERASERERGSMHVNTLGLCNCHAGCGVLLYLAPRVLEERDKAKKSSHNNAYIEALSMDTQ